jgi:hypothetical protein
VIFVVNKKTNARFTIQLNPSDSKHHQVMRILNNQGFHGKAQYIVDAISYYESNEGRLEIENPIYIDEKMIEVIVNRLLSNKDITISEKTQTHSSYSTSTNKVAPHNESIEEINFDDALNSIGEDGLNAIENAMEMFRRK